MNARRNRSDVVRLAAALLAMLVCAPARAADWPMFRGNAARTGAAAEQAAPPLAKVWEFQAPGGIVSSPAVYDGRVYVGTRANKVYALDAATGAKLWERLTAGWVDSSPAVAGGAVYVSCLGGRLYALDRLTGDPLWIADLGAASASSPLVLNGRVYVGTGAPENRLKVYAAATGALLGSYQAAQPVDSAPSTDGAYVYFGANDGKLYALDALTLAPRWPAYPTLGSFGQNAVAVSSGALYFLPGRDEKRASSLLAGTGALAAASPFAVRASTLAFENSVPWMQAGSPAVDAAGFVYYIAAGPPPASYASSVRLAALSSGTLSASWAVTAGLGAASAVGVLASPALANDVLYAATPAGRLAAFGPAAAPLADLDLSSPAYASPAVSNGMVIAANYGGLVTGFRAARRSAISAPAAGAVVSGTVTVYGYFDSPDLAGYELERSTGGATPVWTRVSSAAAASPVSGGAIADWDVSGLPNGEYLLRLRVLESPASGYDGSALVALRVNSVPLPPADLAAADVPADNGNAIALSWTASPTPGITAYRVYRDDGGGYALLASTPGLAYVDSSALTGSTYAYGVSAWDGWAESERVDEAYAFSTSEAADGAPPAAITDLAASPGAPGGRAWLSWTAPGDDGDAGSPSHYLLRYSTDPAQDWSGFDGLAGSSSPAGGPAGITESAELGGLYGGVTYYFTVKAVDAAGNTAALSNQAQAWASLDSEPPRPPSAPSVADTPGDEGGSLDLSWGLSPDDGAGAGDVYGYRVFRRTSSAPFVSTAPYASLPAGATFYADPAAALNVRYYYALAAYDGSSQSVLSPEGSGVSADNWRFFDSSRGGLVLLPDGMQVDVPADSASQNDKILVTRLDPATYAPLFGVRAAAAANPTGVVYQVRFQNPATRLLRPAVIALPYTASDVAGMEEENLRVYTLSGGAWKMLNTSSVDAAARKVSAGVSSFSIFRIMEYVPAGGLFADGEVYAHPNPATGDTAYFKIRPAYKADVRVEVYNVAGEKVASLERRDCPAGQASELAWRVRNVASGVYVYRVRAEGGGGVKTFIGKMAVVH